MVDITRRKPSPICTYEPQDPEEDPEPVESEEEPETNNPEDDGFAGYVATVRKIQESLDSISFNLGAFLDMQTRNIYTIPGVGNRLRELRYLMREGTSDGGLLERILSQGDNGEAEDFLNLVEQNIVVNVNLSYYFKIMLVMLTINTVLLVKCMVWDPFA